MEEILRTLSDYQIQALRKGISYEIDLYVNDQKVPTALVKMYYTVTGDISESHAWNTEFTSNLQKRFVEQRLDRIDKFISNISEPINENE